MLDANRSMLLKELFPELAKQLQRDLRQLKRSDLAEQVDALHILDRCRCGAEVCGTFSTQDHPDGRKREPTHAHNFVLDCGVRITEVKGKIIEVETLDPQVTEALRQAIP